METTTRPFPEALPLIRAVRVSIESLPVLLTGSILLAGAALPGLAIGSALSWVAAWPVLCLAMAPVWLALVGTGQRLVIGDAMAIRQVVAVIGEHARLAITIAIVPAALGAALLATLTQKNSSPVIGALGLVLIGCALVVATSLASVWSVALERDSTGLDTWLESVRRTARDPITIVGTTTLAAIGVAIVITIGPVGMLLAGPLAVWLAELNTPTDPRTSP